MSKLVDVRCPACGAPLRIDPKAPFATCTHCRVQSRIERVTSEAELAAPGGQGVIRVVVRSGLQLALRSLAFAAFLFALLVGMLAVSYVLERARPELADDARFVVSLSQGAQRLDTYRALTVLVDGSVVVASDSAQLAFVTQGGEPAGRLDLPLPFTRAQLTGLAANPAGGFYANLGGAIVQVSGPPFVASGVGPALPLDPSARRYAAIAVDPQGQLFAATTSGLFVRVEADGSASDGVPLGIPTYDRPLELNTMVFSPDGRVILRRRYGDEVWSFDPTRIVLTPLTTALPALASSIACLPDGALVYDAGHALMRLDAQGTHTLDLARGPVDAFDYLVADREGGIVTLTVGGRLLRYGPERLRR